MLKRNFSLRNVIATAICLAGMMMFSGCDKDNGDDNGNGNATGTPKAVMNFTAKAGDGQVSLSWNAPSDNGGSEITGYEVTMDNWANKETKTASQLSHTYNGLTNDTQYTFKVRAINAKGAGAESTATATPTAGGGGGAVYDLALLPENVSVTIQYSGSPEVIVIKIGNDYYKSGIPNSGFQESYFKHNNGTWTEYRRKTGGSWEQQSTTFNSSTITNYLCANNTTSVFRELLYPEASAQEQYEQGTVAGNETLLGVITCTKRVYEDDFYKITYWHSDTYKLFFKMDFQGKGQMSGMSYIMSVSKWDTSVTGFGGIDLP